ncbi:MAG: 4'-phosphopantetheinyl transferase superfamily protein [Flavobacterium sp.]|nr:4'-phosphopantetheinyl transferase superfamily protein [Flavobacterium sp.]
MPLFKIINHSKFTKILVWHITETLSELAQNTPITVANTQRINTMKSEIHQRAFLSIRKLLQQISLTDTDLCYDETGKPHLTNNQFISISHSHEFATIIVSDQQVGIDIEMLREKIITIADKFSVEFLNKKVKQNYIKKLTVIWGAKEAIFKILNQKGISFKSHITVDNFNLLHKQTNAIVTFNATVTTFSIFYFKINNYMLVYAM